MSTAGDGEPIRHPGHGGAHMVAKAAAEVEAALPVIAAPTLQRWALAVERLAS